MNKLSYIKNGFTLVEVLVSVIIMSVFLLFPASMLINSQLLASYSKHKIQAAYAAQLKIETYRQQPFVVVTPGNVVNIPATPPYWQYVVLDSKGNYNNINANYCNTYPNNCAKMNIQVTPAVYTGMNGVAQAPSTMVDHYVVTLNWVEQILNKQVTITDTYTEDIANAPMLN